MLLIAQQRWGEVGAGLNVAERSRRVLPEQSVLRVIHPAPESDVSWGPALMVPNY